MPEPPKRVAVVGRAGAGKTTYAMIIGQSLDLPVTHLDALYWTHDWREVERAMFERRQGEVIATDSWVIDGSYLSSPGWITRAGRADLIVVAEAPLLICMWRVLRRALKRTDRRPDRPPGAREQVSVYFLWWIATWSRRHPGLADHLRDDGHRVVVVRSVEDLVTILDAFAPD